MMLYCSPVWWGFARVQEREALEGIIRRLVRQGYLPLSSVSFETLCSNADTRLFACILHNPCHVLHKLLPPIKQSRYSLRPRSHNRELPYASIFLEADGRVVRLGDGYAVAAGAYEVARDLVATEAAATGEITLARFRDLAGVGRRDAQLLLERMDVDGLTRRIGDRRVLRRAGRGMPVEGNG